MKNFLIAVLLCVLSIGTPQTANSKPKKPLIDREQIAQFEQTVQQNIATPEFTTSLSATTLDNGDFDIKKYETPEPEHLTREEYLQSFDERQCPDPFTETDWEVKNRHPKINSTFQHGDFCTFGNHVVEGKIRKHEMDHSNPTRRGICTCSATACINGYKVVKGECQEIVADENGNCIRKEFPIQSGINDTMSLCAQQCKEHANKNNCTQGTSMLYKGNNTNLISQKACVCNETEENKNANNAYFENRKFQKAQAKLANISFKNVCNTLYAQRDHDHETCVDKVFADINVQKIHGVALAKEYLVYHAKLKYELIECEKDMRQSSNNQDYISCSGVSLNGVEYYYEFEFDDLVESWDSDLHEDFRVGLCEKVFNRHFDGKACNPQGLYNTNEFIEAATRVGIFSHRGNGNAVHLTKGISKENYKTNTGNEWTAGFEPRKFYKNIQASSSLEHILYEYILELLHANADELVKKAQNAGKAGLICNAGYVTHTGKIDGQDTEGSGDDVLTCILTLFDESTKLDFVFDDLSELSDDTSKAAYEQISCEALGGTATETMCINVTKEMCERIATLEPTNKPVWDADNQICKLQNAESAQTLAVVMDLTLVIGGMILTAALVATTGGAILAVLAIAGSTLEFSATQAIKGNIKQFFIATNNCRESEQNCAKDLIKKWLPDIYHYLSDATDTEANAIDKELSRLALLLPPDDSLFTDIKQELENENFWETMETEHVLRAFGRGLQIISIGGAIRTLFVKGVNKIPILTRTLKMKLSTTKSAIRFAFDVGSDAYDSVNTVTNVISGTTITVLALSQLEFRRKASRFFDKHLKYFKENGVNEVGMPKSRLNDDEWAQLNISLQHDHQVHLIDYTGEDGKLYMMFANYVPPQS